MLLPVHIGSSWRLQGKAGVEEGVWSHQRLRPRGGGSSGVSGCQARNLPALFSWPRLAVCPPGLTKPDTKFPLLQQREPFKKRWFALDPQERRLLYYKNPLVRVTDRPSAEHQRWRWGQSWSGNMGIRQGWKDPARDTPPSLVVSKSSLCMKLCSSSPSGSPSHVSRSCQCSQERGSHPLVSRAPFQHEGCGESRLGVRALELHCLGSGTSPATFRGAPVAFWQTTPFSLPQFPQSGDDLITLPSSDVALRIIL